MSVPPTSRQIVITAPGKAEVQEKQTPKLRDDYVLVKTTAYAANPTDWKGIWNSKETEVGATVGCDYAGVVVQVGDNLARKFKPGDRIAGLAHGINTAQHEDGAFGEYIVAKTGIAAKIPDNMTDEEASTFGVGISTVGQGLYQTLNLPLPTDAAAVAAASGTPILIYGGTTATGLLGIQFAKLSGFRVLTTASPSPANVAYLRSLGADEVYDYHAPDWAEKVFAATEGKLRYAWDCIGDEASARGCAAALDRESGAARYAGIMWVDPAVVEAANPGIAKPYGMTVAYTMTGEAFPKFGREWPEAPADYEFGTMFWGVVEGLLAQGKIRGARTVVNQGGQGGLKGLLAAMEGLKDSRVGAVSGGKLVFLK